MSNAANMTEYLTLILQAIADNKITAKELLAMNDQQREAYKDRLVAEEKAEIERGKELLAGSEPGGTEVIDEF